MKLKSEDIKKPIEITDNITGHVYVLDFNRDTVRFAEDRGFTWTAFGDRPATMIPIIWYAAFRRYEPRISQQKTDAILEKVGGIKPEWVTRLHELYDQALAPLISVDEAADEEDAKNAEMTVSL